jgi:4-hydroxy-4-methyl-2-oxoglutarate aldolase
MTTLSPTQLSALGQIDSPTVSNAIEAFKVRDPTSGYGSMDLHCLLPQLSPMVGYALTVTADSTSPLPKRTSLEIELFRAVESAPKPVVVVMKDIGPDRLRSCHAGDNLASIFQKLGAVGMVTDGGIRDLDGIERRAPGFQVFACGQVVSHGVPTFLEIGPTVSICGLTIRPGDLLHGDRNGLVAVPADWVDAVIERAHAILDKERNLVEFIHGDSFSLDGLIQLMYH